MAKTQTKGYKVGEYKNGITKYNCNYCFFDSFDENEIKRHIKENHTPKKPPEKKYMPMKDRFGNYMYDSKGEILYKEYY